MFNPYKKSVRFEHFEEKSDESDESDESEESDDDMKKGHGQERSGRNWFVNIFYSFYYMVKYTGKYSYNLLKNMAIYTIQLPRKYVRTFRTFRTCILGSCVGLGIYYFIGHK